MKWEDVINRDDIIAGCLEIYKDGYVYHSPISNIYIKFGMVCFESPWVARRSIDLSTGMDKNSDWEVWNRTSFEIDKDVYIPKETENGNIQFNVPVFKGFAFIFPKGSDRELDPSEIKGLEII